MAEAAVSFENYPPVRKEELEKYLKRFPYTVCGDKVKQYYITNQGCMMNIRDIKNIHCIQNAQINLELKGGKGNKVWQALEDEINRRKPIER